MSNLDPFDDPVLGQLVWNLERSSWRSELRLPTGATVGFALIPYDSRLPRNQHGFDRIYDHIVWIKNNEPLLRSRIAAAMFDWWLEAWYDEDIDTVTTSGGFADAISLAGVNVYEDHKVHVHYNDGDLIGGHGIVMMIDSDGQFTDAPNIWG